MRTYAGAATADLEAAQREREVAQEYNRRQSQRGNRNAATNPGNGEVDPKRARQARLEALRARRRGATS